MARQEPLTRLTRKRYPRLFQTYWKPIGSSSTSKWTADSPFVSPVRVTDSVTYGVNWPLWSQRLAQGLDTTTGLVGKKFLARYKPLYFEINGIVGKGAEGFGRRGQGESPLWLFPPSPSDTLDSTAERGAASQFLASYIKATQSWAGGSAIAEFSETVRMLGRPIDSLYRHTWTFVGRVGRLKRMFRRDPVKYGKLLGSLWLAYALGIAPTVSDINDAHAAVVRLSERLGSVDRYPLFGFGENRVLEDITAQIVPGAGYVEQERTSYYIAEVRYKGVVRAKPPGIGAIAENFGVGFADILPSVWEGIPWSWLVDYFVNVNEMLDSIRLASADFAWTARTVRNRRVFQYSDGRVKFSPSDSLVLEGTAGGGQGFFQAASVNRGSVDVPYPSWSFRIPGLPRQFANIAALYAAIRNSRPTDRLIGL